MMVAARVMDGTTRCLAERESLDKGEERGEEKRKERGKRKEERWKREKKENEFFE